MQVARYLAAHPRIGRVHHPALNPDLELVESQQSGHSGLFSFELSGAGFPEVRDFINALEVPRIGVSWGGVESLVISPHRGTDEEHLEQAGLPRGLVRISVGLEGADRIVADLDQALART